MKKRFLNFILMTVIATTACLAQESNPLLAEWKTPHQTPPFSQIKLEHYKPAFEAAMKEHRAAVTRIVKQKEAPTFENTIVALELAGERLERVEGIFDALNECYTTDEMQALSLELAPLLSDHYNSIMLDERLFARVKAVYDQRNSLSLNPEQTRLLEQTYKGFVRRGALLGKKEKKQYAKNAAELSRLTMQFNQNVLADDNAFVLHLTKRSLLAGLPQSAIDAAKAEAVKRDTNGWCFTLKAPSYRPFMMYCEDPRLRQVMWTAYNTRANHGDANDNNEIIRSIVRLRYEQARLLGYENYAAYVLDDRMAQTPEAVSAFLQELAEVTTPLAQSEYGALSRYAASNYHQGGLMPWDFSFWAERMKQHLFSLDAEALRPYFPADSVLQGIFSLYGRLYGLTFRENPSIEVYQPEVKAFEVRDGQRLMGILYLDLYPNAGKSGGAWVTRFRSQSSLPHFTQSGSDRPLVQLVCNFTRPVGDTPALLSFDELETLMHEFGHAIHSLLSDVTYPSLSCTAVQRDFVELPSQIMENWCYEQEFLNTFARHYQTGEPIPAEYIQSIKASKNYLAAWYCVRQLNFGIADLAYHTLTAPFDGKAQGFEYQNTINILPIIPGTCFSTAFGHIFAGGYASGYYGYKWAEVLDADAFSQFQRNGIFDAKTAQRFRQTILSRGGTKPASELYRDFMGRDPKSDALMQRCGFRQSVVPMKKQQ